MDGCAIRDLDCANTCPVCIILCHLLFALCPLISGPRSTIAGSCSLLFLFALCSVRLQLSLSCIAMTSTLCADLGLVHFCLTSGCMKLECKNG